MAIIVAGHPLNTGPNGGDQITSTDKITSAYFTDSNTQLDNSDLFSASISDTNETYYYGIAKGDATGSIQFHVTYGNAAGKGGNSDIDNVKSPTEAVYKYWANTLLPENEVTGGFVISSPSVASAVASGKDTEVYVLVANRSLMKDRLNKKNWTIALSGSLSNGSGSRVLRLTDDSNTVVSTPTPAGPRYNIITGSQGVGLAGSSSAAYKTYGWFYPDHGALVFSGAELSASIPGKYEGTGSVATYFFVGSGSGTVHPGHLTSGFGFNDGTSEGTAETQDYNNALRFINVLKPDGAFMQFRDEEDLTSVSYFCRVTSQQGNFSNNPTFISGSLASLRHKTMKGNPTTYISGIELYNSSGDVMAVGKLSTPLKKNFSSEATIKVKLTF
tara:strand:+ start:757 stop:1917 length:1161 start_codon:yes stop_codon:yes gene_type:complete